VVAMKMLDEMGELRSAPGRIAVGVLIAQDLAVVPMLILVSSLGGEAFDFGDVAFKVVVAVVLLYTFRPGDLAAGPHGGVRS
ncbi:MAG TPA: hypothetical protein PK101_11150, partial [Thauera sp.]|nr:hypothetical protein [Thauera sp.]